ncbi:HAMP domain-containing sensor histidine kinase [Streptomyces sp. NPDC047017]|uniref:sensor histidine kinase n=1 Tax=Streptomyces sp. NPDC047017 TaxID=3155024 RepID=UPI0033C0C209
MREGPEKARTALLGGLRLRLVAGFAVVAAVSCLSTGVLTFREARTGVLQQSQDAVVKQFRDSVDARAPGFPDRPGRSDLDHMVADLAYTHRSQQWRFLATYGSLRAVYGPRDSFDALSPELVRSVRTRSAAVFQRVRRDGQAFLVVGLPVAYAASATPSGLVLYLVVPQETEQLYVRALITAIERATLPALGLAVVVALLVARGVLRPVRALGRATRRMAAGHLDTRLTVHGSDELAELSRTFNDTAAALEESVAELRRMEARARRFAADVSHELRTPLAAMTAVTDVLDERATRLDRVTGEAVRLVSGETARLARLVDDLMEISRFDAGAVELGVDEIDLAESVRRTLAARGWRDRVTAELPAAGALRARVDPRRLDVVVANLVGNALRHGAPPVTLRLTAGGAGRAGSGAGADGWFTLTVTDEGPGIPEADLPHVFERFYKASRARTRSESSGLGLAITAENVRLHGGRVRAANRPGGGALFTVELPLRQHSGADTVRGDAPDTVRGEAADRVRGEGGGA